MKTKKLSRSLILLAAAMVFGSITTLAQNKTVTIKIVKDVNGVVTQSDTTFEWTGDSMPDPMIIMNEELIDLPDLPDIPVPPPLPDGIEDSLFDLDAEIEMVIMIDSLGKVCEEALKEGGNKLCKNKMIVIDEDENEKGEKHRIVKRIVMSDSCIAKCGDNKKDCKMKVVCIGEDGVVEKTESSGNKVMKVKIDPTQKGRKMVFVSRIEIKDLSEQDMELLKKKGGSGSQLQNALPAEDFKFFPNPTDGKFTLSFMLKEQGNTKIEIVDMQGKVVYSEDLKQFSGKYSKDIDISASGKGTYIAIITQGDKTLIRKIVIG